MNYNVSDFLTLLNKISWKIGQSLQDWGEQLLSHLAEATDSVQGALFCADSKQENLYLTSFYALKEPDKIPNEIKFGDGLTGTIAKFQKTKVINQNIPDQFNNYAIGEEFKPKSIILIPIIFNKITYGVIEFTKQIFYTDEETFFFKSIIQIVGVQLILLIKEQQQQQLLENLREKNSEIQTQSEKLYELNDEISVKRLELEEKNQKIGKSLRNIRTITEFGQKITATLDFKSINKIAYDYTSTLMNTSGFGIGVYDDFIKGIEFTDFKEPNKVFPLFYRKLSEEQFSVWCYKNSKHIIINDLEKEYSKYFKKIPDFGKRIMPQSLLYVPLIVKERTIGVITVNSYEKNTYKKDDLLNLKALASYIAIALDNGNAYEIINFKNKSISESINYGKKIQQLILPSKKELNKIAENFLIFLPKDIVSGDFYWHSCINDTTNIVAIVDCTGHGVPGAFMSMIGNRLLNEIINEKKIYSPKIALDKLNLNIKKFFKQKNSDITDGMDLSLCLIEQLSASQTKVTFSGAKQKLFYIKKPNLKLEYLKGDRISIGSYIKKARIINFTNQSLTLNKDDIIYLTTDGFIDQNNIERKRFGSVKLMQLIDNIYKKPLPEQKKIMLKAFNDWKKDGEQRDDITLMGIKF